MVGMPECRGPSTDFRGSAEGTSTTFSYPHVGPANIGLRRLRGPSSAGTRGLTGPPDIG